MDEASPVREPEVPTTVEGMLGPELLGRSIACDCGRTHRVLTRLVVVEPGVSERVAELLPSLSEARRLLLIADRRTWQVAGEQLADSLRSRYLVEHCLLEDDASGHVHASVKLVDELAAASADNHDLLVAVGSGTVNDVTKELAHRRGRPYVVFATAASMNGYTSAIVAFLDRGLKTTRPSTPPVAVFADPRIIAAAPRDLTLAGLGDLVSKPYCGCDWRIASLIRDEYHCPLPDRMLARPFARALEHFPALAHSDAEAVTLLLRLLLVSGITMAVAGTSSPASGAEHLLSHYWDMTHLRDGRPLALHGAQVGVASLVIDTLYRRIQERDPGTTLFRESPPLPRKRQEVERVFGSLAPAVWPEWRAKLQARSEQDLQRLCRHRQEIWAEIGRTLSTGEKVRQALTASGAPTRAAQLGLDDRELVAAVRYGRMIRTRYTALDVAAELGLLEPFARELEGGLAS